MIREESRTVEQESSGRSRKGDTLDAVADSKNDPIRIFFGDPGTDALAPCVRAETGVAPEEKTERTEKPEKVAREAPPDELPWLRHDNEALWTRI